MLTLVGTHGAGERAGAWLDDAVRSRLGRVSEQLAEEAAAGLDELEEADGEEWEAGRVEFRLNF
jgi:hypothetical protein